ncbi:MAG: metallopeptidase family protein [Oscillospiraceae bacterium]
MMTFDQAGDLLDQIAEEFPPEFYRELNGGIALLPEEKEDPENPGLCIMGEYCTDELGRYIRIYYGSFQSVCGDLDDDDLYEELYTTLSHEFTHHLEALAGERGLELKDEEFMREYRKEKEGK